MFVFFFFFLFFFFFFFKQKTAYEMLRSLVGSEMCIRDRYQRRVRGSVGSSMARDGTMALTLCLGLAISLAGADPSAMQSHTRNVVVLMADTRDLPREAPNSFEDASWQQLVAVCNMKYAQKHGYEFVHYLMGFSGDPGRDTLGNDQRGCAHPVHGLRHPSWCKLLSVFETLKQESKLPKSDQSQDPLVMYVDSDMVFNKPTVTIEQYLNRSPVCNTIPMPNLRLIKEGFPLQGQVHPGHKCDAECVEARSNASLLVNVDPNGNFGNCGMQMWRSTDPEKSMELLSEFWNLNDPGHNTGFPWEQYSFNHALWPEHQDQIRLIEDTDEFSNPMFTQPAGFLKHVVGFQDITHPGTRKKMFLESAQGTYGLSFEAFKKDYQLLMQERHFELSPTHMGELANRLADRTWNETKHMAMEPDSTPLEHKTHSEQSPPKTPEEEAADAKKAEEEAAAAASAAFWADEAYSLEGKQADYTRVMAVAVDDREAEYKKLKLEIESRKQDRAARDDESNSDTSSAHKAEASELLNEENAAVKKEEEEAAAAANKITHKPNHLCAASKSCGTCVASQQCAWSEIFSSCMEVTQCNGPDDACAFKTTQCADEGWLSRNNLDQPRGALLKLLGIPVWVTVLCVSLLIVALVFCICRCCCDQTSGYTRISAEESGFDCADEDILGEVAPESILGFDTHESDSDEATTFEMGITVNDDKPPANPQDPAALDKADSPPKRPNKPVSGRLAPPREKRQAHASPSSSPPKPDVVVPSLLVQAPPSSQGELSDTAFPSAFDLEATVPDLQPCEANRSKFPGAQATESWNMPSNDGWDEPWEDVSDTPEVRPMSTSVASDKSIEDIVGDLEAALRDDYDDQI
eukprot:TRINITY_DN956_c0_g1_i17.p1 TRINITY_DN956_c0_g1~~TRINITY_DN956_c0_g1_i17.p1  ORF type:complete len:862 (+),score=184.42 TRINITY_DN956_c0_g1_i17:101-2686(+)